jgi:hypothetical protein
LLCPTSCTLIDRAGDLIQSVLQTTIFAALSATKIDIFIGIR